jgi:hypothetical protein
MIDPKQGITGRMLHATAAHGGEMEWIDPNGKEVKPLIEGTVIKGGQNPPQITGQRPLPPQGSCRQTSFTLPRTGQPPLAFTGTLLADVCGHYVNGHEQVRYHELALYKSDTPLEHANGFVWDHVFRIAYVSRFKAEIGYNFACSCRGPDDARWTIENQYDPTCHIAGYPPLPAYAARQKRLIEDVQRAYWQLVSEFLGKIISSPVLDHQTSQ